jgi:uncharacterized protein YacL
VRSAQTFGREWQAGVWRAGRGIPESSTLGTVDEFEELVVRHDIAVACLDVTQGLPVLTVSERHGGLIIGMLGNIMNLLQLSSEPQMVVKGILIIIAVMFISGGVKRLASHSRWAKLKGMLRMFRRRDADIARESGKEGQREEI